LTRYEKSARHDEIYKFLFDKGVISKLDVTNIANMKPGSEKMQHFKAINGTNTIAKVRFLTILEQGSYFGPAKSGNFWVGLEFGRQSKGNLVGKFGNFGGSGKSGISVCRNSHPKKNLTQGKHMLSKHQPTPVFPKYSAID